MKLYRVKPEYLDQWSDTVITEEDLERIAGAKEKPAPELLPQLEEVRIGDKIREARKNKRYTQARLGALCGYEEKSAERVVQLWEHDKQPVPMYKLRKLSDVLDIPLDDLIP